MSHIKN